MRRPPFKMLPSRRAVLTCDGKFVISGRASFVWETFLLRRAAGVPGEYAIRADRMDSPWHRLNWTIAEGTEMLAAWGFTGPTKVRRMEKMRASREARGLDVA